MNIPVIIFPNSDGSFTVSGAGLNFVTEGDTLEEALENAREAAELHIEGLRMLGKDHYELVYLEQLSQSFNTVITIPSAINSQHLQPTTA